MADKRDLRRALGRFATGVTLVTAADETGPLGLVVNSFTSVSLDPPLVAIFPSRTSFTWSRMRRCERLGINVLATDHADYVRAEAQPGADRFGTLDFELCRSGVPRVRDALAFLECEPVSEQTAGDHWIVVARVNELISGRGGRPLAFWDGRFGTFAAA